MATTDIIRLYFEGGSLHVTASLWLVGIVAAVVLGVYGALTWRHSQWTKEFEIDEAELGIGSQKLKLRPNYATAQVAYKLWIELSTRKVGLPIDFTHDVIAEVYDSWYEFFRVTRDLLKEIPASQLRGNGSTERLVSLAIDVLNEGLRPHLTQWQARFRRWFEAELARAQEASESPQDIQSRFPKYAELRGDMEAVNAKLIAYRRTVRRIVFAK